ncbi:MAG: hypothetical protein QGF69_03030 [Candidatus Marinimicrobia bacterium]|nr:hypothetical protein [Candidatus Neomarinimicrobiota bacterium]HJL75219.1 hypothetical protein [Candidatus Neomarinimicrobiota bacterium]
MRILKNTLLLLISLSLAGCGKPAKNGFVTMMVTANVRAQLDPCG